MSNVRDHQRTQPAIRFKGFTDAWEKRKLGELGNFVRDSINPQDTPAEKFAEYSMPAFDNGRTPQVVLGKMMQSLRLKISGNVLLINKLNVRQRRIWWLREVEDNAVTSSEFVPFTSDKVTLGLLEQIMLSDKVTRDMEAMSSGTSNSQKRITPSDLAKYELGIPEEVIEQTKIGAFFSRLDSLIAVNQRKGDVLQNLKKGLLQRLFASETSPIPDIRFKGFTDAWEKRKLGELANIRRGASPRPIKNKKWFSQTSQVGWIRISDVTEQNGRIHQVEQYLSDAGQKKTLVLKSKHLLLSIAATVGKPVQNYIQVGVHDGFIVFMDPKFDLDFMFYFLEKYRPNWARFGQPGSQININSELVRDLVVSIPTVHEQVAVAQFIITLENLIAATKRKGEVLKNLKKALLQKMFV